MVHQDCSDWSVPLLVLYIFIQLSLNIRDGRSAIRLRLCPVYFKVFIVPCVEGVFQDMCIHRELSGVYRMEQAFQSKFEAFFFPPDTELIKTTEF